MERNGTHPNKAKTHVKVVPIGGGEPLDRRLTKTEIANLESLGYGVSKVVEPKFLRPRVPPKGSEEEKTANGEQWWQKY